MPTRPKRPCSYPGCTALVDSGRCTQHRTDIRPSAGERGYDRRWQKLSAAYRAAHPLCQMCSERGETTPADLVHHIHPVASHPHLRLFWNNLMSVCASCHAKIHTNPGGADRLPPAHLQNRSESII